MKYHILPSAVNINHLGRKLALLIEDSIRKVSKPAKQYILGINLPRFKYERALDFIDIFFIQKEKKYNLKDLIIFAQTKFDWHIDPVQLGSRFLTAAGQADYPRMIKKINHQEWKDFFVEEARKLKKQIFK